MLHVLYIIAFAAIASFAIANLFRNMMMLGRDVRQGYGNAKDAMTAPTVVPNPEKSSHPELLDESGEVVREPFLVLKSISVDDAREKLDAIYKASPGGSADDDDVEPVA